VSKDERDPAHIPVADVLALYARDIASSHARPRETAQRITVLLGFFGDKMLNEINARCAGSTSERERPTQQHVVGLKTFVQQSTITAARACASRSSKSCYLRNVPHGIVGSHDRKPRA
jgi:hypothetical protein